MKELDILQPFLDKLKPYGRQYYIIIPCDNSYIADELMRALAKRDIWWKDWNDGNHHLLSSDNRWTRYKTKTAYVICVGGLIATDNLVVERLKSSMTDHVVLHPSAILFDK